MQRLRSRKDHGIFEKGKKKSMVNSIHIEGEKDKAHGWRRKDSIMEALEAVVWSSGCCSCKGKSRKGFKYMCG